MVQEKDEGLTSDSLTLLSFRLCHATAMVCGAAGAGMALCKFF